MKWVWCAGAATLLAITFACAAKTRLNRLNVASTVTDLRVKPERGPVRRVALEDYVRGAIISEFDPPSGDPAVVEQMLEVQAVLARTYVLAHLSRHSEQGFDLCASTHCQLYDPDRLTRSMWKSAVDQAMKRTAGVVLWYHTSLARALFHADCGGHTSAADDVWEGLPRPYLLAKRDDGPGDPAHLSWRFDVDAEALRSALNSDSRTRVGSQLLDIRVINRDAGGRASRVALVGTQPQSVRGEGLRAVLTRSFGVMSIRSTRFEIQRRGKTFHFVGTGFGHGVGLCQTGAYARLSAGARPEQVLAHYYPGTRLIILH